MPHRQMSEVCPRCKLALVGDRPMRRCLGCKGHWVDGEHLAQLAAQMTTPPRPIALAFLADPRPRLGCPGCGREMDPWKVHGVPIDRCAAHGVWFDRDELEHVLHGVVDPPGSVSLARVAVTGKRLGKGDASWVFDLLGILVELLGELL